MIDHDNDSYTFYRKGRRIYTGHVHNIYIRLVGQKGGEVFKNRQERREPGRTPTPNGTVLSPGPLFKV